MTLRGLGILIFFIMISGCSSVVEKVSDGPIEDAEGARTLGQLVEDESIELKISVNLAETNLELKSSNINVNSYNGLVLLTGQVPTEKSRTLAARVAGKVKRVKRVENQLSLGPVTTLLNRSSDTLITTKVRAVILNQFGYSTMSRVKIVTEESNVYLMGMLTRLEASAITKEASKVNGIKRIVEIYEYID